MNGNIRHALLVSVLALGACAVGPDYKVPDSALVNAPSAKGDFVEAADRSVAPDALPHRWWRLYDDPRLDGFVEQALTENTNLRMANANLERSYALLREAKTLQQPSVALAGGIQYGQTSGEQFLQPITPPLSTDYQGGITIGYDLDLFGRIRRGIEAASANSEAVAAARDLVVTNVAAETSRAYADICGTGLQLATARRSLALQNESLSLTRRLFAGGRATDLDVTRQRQLVNQLAQAVPKIEAAQRGALFRLAALTGKLPAQIDTKLESCAAPPRLTQPLPIGDGATLLKRRPDIREAEREVATASAEIGVATADLYPTIVLGVSAGSVGITEDFLKSTTNFWNIGAQLSWQANQSAARAKIAAANAAAKLALANFDGVVLAALRDTETALTVYTHDLRSESSARAARDDAQTAVQQALLLQRGGRATALSVLDAQRTLASTEQSLAQLESAISDDQVAVFLALGGGWETDDAAGDRAANGR